MSVENLVIKLMVLMLVLAVLACRAPGLLVARARRTTIRGTAQVA